MNELIEAMPKAWSEVSISKWQDICRIKEEDDTERLIQILTILLECSEEQIRDLDLLSWRDLVNSTQFLNKKIKAEVKTEFELLGKVYGIIPKVDARFISTGEFLDIESWKQNPTENLHLIAAMIYRPIIGRDGETYRIAKYERDGFMARAELFKNNLPITSCYDAVLFFSAYVMKSTEIIADYLLATTQMEKKKMEKKKRLTVMKKHK